MSSRDANLGAVQTNVEDCDVQQNSCKISRDSSLMVWVEGEAALLLHIAPVIGLAVRC
jgi:hypothetical protein